MKEKLIELIKQLDPELQVLVAEVIEKEREYLDYLRPRGVVEEIRDLVDKYAKEDLGLIELAGKK
jgi:cell division protein FtsB